MLTLAEAEKAPLNEAPQSQESTTGEAPAAAPAEAGQPQAEADQPDPERQGSITHEQLVEIVSLKKQCRINDPAAWGKLVGNYHKPDGTPHVTAKEFTEEQADEFIKDLIRLRENPTSLNSGTAGKPSTP